MEQHRPDTAFIGIYTISASHEFVPGFQFKLYDDCPLTTVAASLDAELADFRDSLSAIARYDDGWDGYRGRTIDPASISWVRNAGEHFGALLSQAASSPDYLEIGAGPASDGSLDLEVAWGDRRATLSHDPDEPLTIQVLLEIDDSYSTHAVDADSASLERWASWLTSASDMQDPLEETWTRSWEPCPLASDQQEVSDSQEWRA